MSSHSASLLPQATGNKHLLRESHGFSVQKSLSDTITRHFCSLFNTFN